MVDWLWANKEWVFSGVGVAVVIALTSIIGRVLSKRAPVGSMFRQILPQSADRANRVARPIAAVPQLLPEAIVNEVNSAPVLQKDAVGKRYAGLPVAWDAQLCGANVKDGTVKLFLRVPEKGVRIPSLVVCEVKLADYPQLSILKADHSIHVVGTIHDVSPTLIMLTPNPALTIGHPPPQ